MPAVPEAKRESVSTQSRAPTDPKWFRDVAFGAAPGYRKYLGNVSQIFISTYFALEFQCGQTQYKKTDQISL